MTDYRSMYCVLCHAADEVVDRLERIPGASRETDILKAALLEAENIYIETSDEDKNK